MGRIAPKSGTVDGEPKMRTREFSDMERSVLGEAERRAKYRKTCEAIEALSAKDARTLQRIEEQIGAPLKCWPDDPRTKMLSSRLDFKGRFCLYLFVVGNVVPPELFIDWVIQRGMLRVQSSARHLINVVKAHQTGKLEAEGKTYWDMNAHEKRTIITPNFAMESQPSYTCTVDGNGVEVIPPGAEFWENAIAKLEAHLLTLPRE